MNLSIAFPPATSAPVFKSSHTFQSYETAKAGRASDSSVAAVRSQLALPTYMAAKLAREVRNPLTCINLSIDMINSAITVAECKAYIDTISKSSKRISKMINELLECQEIADPFQAQN